MPATDTSSDLYLDLLEKCLTRYGFDSELSRRIPEPRNPIKAKIWALTRRALEAQGIEARRSTPFNASARSEGRDWPEDAETMVGLARLRNIRECATKVIQEEIPGDFIETGVWRGGACILMRGILAAIGVSDRTVWVADSFRGLPPPSGKYAADAEDLHHTYDALMVSRGSVEANFERYGLLDGQVRFLEGWFSEVLPGAPIDRLAILRLDGDMYESTIDALNALYAKLSPGGYLIIDDYGNENTPGCKAAVNDYRDANGIRDEIQAVDWTGAYWRKTGE